MECIARQFADSLPTIDGKMDAQNKVKENKRKESKINQVNIIESPDELKAALRGAKC